MKLKSVYGAEARNHYLSRLEKLQADTPAQWGKMNVGEMMSHLGDALKEVLGDRQSSNKSNLMMRSVGKFFVLNFSFPKGAPTHPEFNPKVKGTKPGSFDADKAQLASLISRVTEIKPGAQLPVHPLMGPFSYEQWGKLTAKHLDHHFRQFGV